LGGHPRTVFIVYYGAARPSPSPLALRAESRVNLTLRNGSKMSPQTNGDAGGIAEGFQLLVRKQSVKDMNTVARSLDSWPEMFRHTRPRRRESVAAGSINQPKERHTV
jgi:hypothetical protein